MKLLLKGRFFFEKKEVLYNFMRIGLGKEKLNVLLYNDMMKNYIVEEVGELMWYFEMRYRIVEW